MNEATTEVIVPITPEMSINTMLADRVARKGDETLIERRDSEAGPWMPVTAKRFVSHVTSVARGLIAYGIEPGDRVAIMSRTRYEWTLLDYACWAVGAVPVPIYETSSIEQIEWILTDTGAKMVVVEKQIQEFAIESILDKAPAVEHVLVIDKGAMRRLRDAGKEIPEAEVIARRDAVMADDLATIIYSSGTTGRPKGVELTHGNFCHDSLNVSAMLPDVVWAEGTRTLIFLPLAHVYARVVQVVVISTNCVLGHAPDIKNLVDDLQSFQPTFLLLVPRVLEKVFNSAAQKATASNVKKNLFNWATRVSISYSRAQDAGKVSPTLSAAHATAKRLVLNKLRDAMGGKVKYAISGGAPLGERLGHFYRGMGLTVLEGYGLTETTGVAAANMPDNIGIGTVGIPLAGSTIKIADDGEVLIKGPHVFREYRNNPELTAEALQDGWFHTGDIGTLDNDSRLRITGRKKEIIVTAGGKNVAPAVLEDRLRSHPLISQVVVVGDQRPFIGALVTMDSEMLPGWLAAHDLPLMSIDEARTNPVVLARLQRAVDRANQAVSRAESIRKFKVLDHDFTEANGYLTPSMKVKRSLVLRDFAPDIDELYGGPVEQG
ncbi:MAG: AMP-binding protein [Promicromonosporaceae bacterium]|nr:AMP-binding protein [Promicromonosporaceae bacterium]